MTDNNPYEPPPPGTPRPEPSPRLMPWSLVAVAGSTLVGGCVGLFAGLALGTLAPGYYRSVFSRGDSPNFDPVSVGIGQGLTQGLGLGAVVGLGVVGLFYWYRSRLASAQR